MADVLTMPEFQTERGALVVESLYISGPMTGYDEYNFPAFRAAADDLRQRGFKVHSPHEMDEEGGFEAPAGPTPLEYTPRYFKFLARDMALVASGEIDGAVFLPGWQASRGARAEYRWCQDLALVTLSYPTLEWLEYRPADKRTNQPAQNWKSFRGKKRLR